jgi:sec-independent protein translocase protein TatA
MMLPLAFLSPSFGEMVLVAIIALLLYGSDLPQVARSWGKTYQEFRKHLSGMQRDLNNVIYAEEDEHPQRLQYYPEFRDETGRDAPVVDVEHTPDPAATFAEGEAEQLAASENPPAAAVEEPTPREAPPRDGAHGAA